MAKNGENQRKRDQAAQLRDSVKRAHEEVTRLSELLETAKQKHLQLVKDLDIAETSAKDLTDQSTEELETNISNIEEINRKVRANLDKEKAEDDAKEYRTKYDNLTKQLEETRDKKNELLTSAELPLPELSVKDGELIYNFSVCGGFIIHNCCDALRYAVMTAWRYIKQWLPTEIIDDKEYIVDIARKEVEEDGYI